MGACNSHSAITDGNYQINRSPATPTSTVITHSGELRRYKAPITVHQVLESEPPQSFICNSDALVYHAFIPTLNPNEELLPDNLYFILPMKKLRHPLNASDMAALAIRASLALQRNNENNFLTSSVRNHCRSISVHGDNGITVGDSGLRKTQSSECNNNTSSMSGSVRKFQRMPSKRVRVAIRSSRTRRLSTIYEAIEP